MRWPIAIVEFQPSPRLAERSLSSQPFPQDLPTHKNKLESGLEQLVPSRQFREIRKARTYQKYRATADDVARADVRSKSIAGRSGVNRSE